VRDVAEQAREIIMRQHNDSDEEVKAAAPPSIQMI